jgi:hypothetical protein
MKATIRYTRPELYARGEEGIVRVAEITHCVPTRDYTLIMLTTGGSITALETLEEIEQRIDEAEGQLREPA